MSDASSIAAHLARAGWHVDPAPLRPESAGQSWVYAASDTTGERDAIVKVYRPEDAAAAAVERQALEHLAESRSVAHPALLAEGTVAVGEHSCPYIVIERLPGAPLDRLLNRSILTIHQRLEIASQLGAALAELHAAGVVHGDVRPANVLVGAKSAKTNRPADYLGVRLIDFGASALVSEDAGGRASPARGSPLYSAPELRRGRGVSPSSDVYAFGLVALDALLDRTRNRADHGDDLRELEQLLREAGCPTSTEIGRVLACCLDVRQHRYADGTELLQGWRRTRFEPNVGAGEPRAGILASFRHRVFGTFECGADEAAGLLAADLGPFLSAVFLASLPREARVQAEEAVEGTRSVVSVAEALLLTAEPVHPAGVLAAAILMQRVTVDGQRAARDSDVTLARGTLLENAASDRKGRPAVRRALLEGMRGVLDESPLFDEYTLARVADRGGRASWRIYAERAVEQSIGAPAGGVAATPSPVVVRLSAAGRIDDEVQPLLLYPFAAFRADGPDLLYPPFEGTLRYSQPPPRPGSRAPVEDREGDETPSTTCVSRPVQLALEGERVHLVTDDGEWLVFDRAGRQINDVQPMQGVARAIEFDGAVYLLRMDEGMVRCRGSEIAHFGADAAVLRGHAVGDVLACAAVSRSTGSVGLFARGGARVASAQLSEPVADLVPVVGIGLAVLGFYGALWTARWPAAELTPIQTHAPSEERLQRIFRLNGPGLIGIGSATTIGVIDIRGRSVALAPAGVEEGVRDVLPLDDAGESLAVLGTTGDLCVVDVPRKASWRAPVHGGSFVGLAPQGPSSFLAWTSSGALLSIGHDRSTRTLIAGGVALARPLGADRLLLVQWDKEAGVRVVVRSNGSEPWT